MSKPTKPSPTESPLLFEVDPEPLAETLTGLGDVPLMVQAFRSLGLPALVKEPVRIKERHGRGSTSSLRLHEIARALGKVDEQGKRGGGSALTDPGATLRAA